MSASAELPRPVIVFAKPSVAPNDTTAICLHILTTYVSAISVCVKCYWSWVLNSVFQLTICVSYMLYMGFYSLRAGRSEDRIPVGARLPVPVQTNLAAHPASCRMATGSLSWGYSGRGVALTTHNPSSAEVKERVELYLCFISALRGLF
jgi:hypothetical protein